MLTTTRTRGPLTPATAEAIRALADDATRHDGVAPLSEQPLLWLTDPRALVAHVLVTETGAGRAVPHDTVPHDTTPDHTVPDDRLIGYAQVDLTVPGTSSAELVVAPTARRRGIGTALLAAVLQEGEAEAPRTPVGRLPAPTPPHRAVHVWAHGDLPAARHLALSAGLTVVRELWQMSLDLTAGLGSRSGTATRSETMTSSLPPGVTVRAFVPGADEDAWCRVNARAFASHPEQGRLTSADVDAREHEPWFDPAGFLLAERDGVLVGSAWTKVHPAGELDAVPVGELYALGIDPDAQGQGLGAALTTLALAHLRARGLCSAVLYTEADNTAAVRTYRRAGFTRAAVDVVYGSISAGVPSGDTMGE